MADAPWRCSQCGTVNEPAAIACRACGRWPSVFDLERGADEVEPSVAVEPDEHYAEIPHELDVPVEPDYSRPTELEAEPGAEPEGDARRRGWPSRIGSLIVPLLIVLYILISIVTNR